MPDVQRLTRLAAVVLITAILLAVPASADPTSPLCGDGSYRARHPLICDTGGTFPTIGGGGGGQDGGLLGTIGRILGGLTGGLL